MLGELGCSFYGYLAIAYSANTATEIPVSKFFTVEAVSVSLNILDVMKKSVKRKMS